MGACCLTMKGQKHIPRTDDRYNSVGRYHVEIFVRPMRYKGCHQAHNAKVVICAILNNAYLAEITGAAKGVFTHSQKFVPYRKNLYSHSQPPNPHSV